jgi:GNAT superfamily N-acetyltransferase
MLKLEFDEHPTAEDLRTILDGVREFNRERTAIESPRAVAHFLRDEEGRIAGGVRGSLWGRSMHIDALWVDDDHRGQGHGSKLMKAIEDYAKAHGHPLVYLETTSFQALPFYEGLGYQLFGELPGISEGHTLFFLQKDMK